MKVILAAVAAVSAIAGGWVTALYVRMHVARANLLGAKKLVKTNRPIFWNALGRFVVAAAIVGVTALGCLYLASTGPR